MQGCRCPRHHRVEEIPWKSTLTLTWKIQKVTLLSSICSEMHGHSLKPGCKIGQINGNRFESLNYFPEMWACQGPPQPDHKLPLLLEDLAISQSLGTEPSLSGQLWYSPVLAPLPGTFPPPGEISWMVLHRNQLLAQMSLHRESFFGHLLWNICPPILWHNVLDLLSSSWHLSLPDMMLYIYSCIVCYYLLIVLFVHLLICLYLSLPLDYVGTNIILPIAVSPGPGTITGIQ